MSLIEYGLVVAADAAAQMLLSPLLGVVIDRLKSVRLVCIACSVMFAAGNVFYALLGAFPRGDVKIRVWMMFVARFIVGAGTTINASARSLVIYSQYRMYCVYCTERPVEMFSM